MTPVSFWLMIVITIATAAALGFFYAERARGLYVLEFAQLQCLATQQTAQACPTGDTQDQAQEQQPQVGPLNQAVELFGVFAHIDLQHQDGGGNQQHVRDGIQRGVDILHCVIDPAAGVAGEDAQRDGAGRSQRGPECGTATDAHQRGVGQGRAVETLHGHTCGCPSGTDEGRRQHARHADSREHRLLPVAVVWAKVEPELARYPRIAALRAHPRLEKFIAWRSSEKYNPEHDPCLKRINLLAHSMGNRVVRGTLANWNRYDLAHGVPLIFRNTFLIAADVVLTEMSDRELADLFQEF